jgi:hypothetical protein
MLVQNYLKNTVADPNGLELSITPYVNFSRKKLRDERALVFGCEPDFNAWRNSMSNTVGGINGVGRSAGKIVCPNL